MFPLSGGSNLPRLTRRVISRLGFRFGARCNSPGSSVNGHCHHRSTVNAPFYVAISRRAPGSRGMALHCHSAVRRRHMTVSSLHNVVRSHMDVADMLGGLNGRVGGFWVSLLTRSNDIHPIVVRQK